MDRNFERVLTGQETNHLLPFLWMHEGHRDEWPLFVKQVYDSGARAFCVESRPHIHFGEEEWWGDMQVILDEARKLDMKVWILDDRHFPTGFANDLIPKKYPERRKWHLTEDHIDLIGPSRDSAVLLRTTNTSDSEEDVLLGVYAYRRDEFGETIADEPIDLNGNIRDGFVFFDVPEGLYRVFALYKTRRGCKAARIHMIDYDSVNVLIEAVYEPHYEHFKEYFGNTIVGFFSDEPGFNNDSLIRGGAYAGGYNQTLGQPGLALPWTEEVLERMNAELGYDAMGKLAGLWYKQGGGNPEVRVAYMNAITRLWEENFSMQLGNWCRAHKVEYIGHVIEDMDAHQRLNTSGGHYFRSLNGQDMAGIDVVLHQVVPGIAHNLHAASLGGGYVDPTFFDYVLARLAASHSHLVDRMADRAMCEIFGAYGWAEGVPMMRHLMDHMLVRGINQFVPHAFSPKFPDPDCPPHFNAGPEGLNPQFEAFSYLMRYTNRACDVIEGTEIVSAAILYTAEAEWSGFKAMTLGDTAKNLYDKQLNYDIVPMDSLMSDAKVEGGKLQIKKMRYSCLIVPYAQWLPASYIETLARLEQAGLPVAFIDGRPEGCSCGRVISFSEEEAFVREAGGTDVYLAEPFDLLRVRHAKRCGCDSFMLVNENMIETFSGKVVLPVNGKGTMADLLNERYEKIECGEDGIDVVLAPGESVFLLFDGSEGFGEDKAQDEFTAVPFVGEWKLSLKRAQYDKEYGEEKPLAALYNIAGREGDPGFSGWMRYRAVFDAPCGTEKIDLGYVGECVHAYLNGKDLGQRIDRPYAFDVKDAIKEKDNELVLEIVNNLVHQQRDGFSRFVQILPSGLIGPVSLLVKKA